MNKAQLIPIGFGIALTALAAYGMHRFFGVFGAILVAVFTLPIIAVVAYATNQGSDGQSSQAHMSKGAREER